MQVSTVEAPVSKQVEPVDEILPVPRLITLGLQHVLVMYAGAVAVPFIVGNALKLSPQDIAFLVSADLFACGIVTIIQSLGASQWFGIKLPVMMGVTFASVSPMLAITAANPGAQGARLLFGTIIGAGVIAMIIAPLVSRLIRFFPPVVTGTIILVIGVSLMKIGIGWIFAPSSAVTSKMVNPDWAKWVEAAKATPGIPELPKGFAPAATMMNPAYASAAGIGMSALVLAIILIISRFGKGFLANVAVLIGIVIGAIVAAATGMMKFDNVMKADWFALIMPFHFGVPVFDIVMILTMTIVMIVVMIESTGMFLALGEMTGRKVTQPMLSAGLRTDGLGTLIGGIFNTFPYTSFSQNVGLVGVTGIKSRWVTITGGIILLILGLVPKMGAIVAALPTAVLGGAGLVMFGMVAATGIRILAGVDFKNRFNPFIVAVSVGFGMIPLIAPDFKQWMPAQIHPMVDSGILLASIVAVGLNFFFNGAHNTEAEMIEAAKQSEA
ncbi:purine permease [Propioniciclava tarda]|uniref:Purine permease n=1 Tax=Propioniciclava tarda TaxID=433330 RepID=A0A4Q9KLS9_PROTD|nr:purine permease [Propioniciclava tarda]